MFSHLCTGEARVVSRHIDLGFIERPHTVLCSPEEEGMSSTTCFFFLNIHIIVLYTHAILKTHNVIIIQKKIREAFFGASFFFLILEAFYLMQMHCQGLVGEHLMGV